ncbi:MAG: phosphoenolpyruvate carboxykinase, partial [Limisphaerales bacterium]
MHTQFADNSQTVNPHLARWVAEVTAHCQPDTVVWCDGSPEEKQRLTAEAVAKGILIPLNQSMWPGCHYHRSNPNDVARVEQCTIICTPTEEEAGPSNNWAAPAAMRTTLLGLIAGA